MNPLFRFFSERKHIRVATPMLLLAILGMVILPLPPMLLDVLFTFNIVLAVVVVLVSVSVKRPLDFSVFPTIILASTLMRLTLNVASTRVVLLKGHEGTHAAGHVIEAFGKVVIGGNFVVGVVVFVILMIINFVVVTKGAERISEVSARFTLDALPGKQMAIDADLNAGLINQDQAQTRRRDVTTEADFYGAMDGASKFVRGDAVAGILVLIVNMLGGLAIGMWMHGLSFTEALHQYGLLTIGDGLAAQIPALLLAAGAAIIVTRVSDTEDFEHQVGQQMLASPVVLYSGAAVMMVLAIIPGMPWLTFSGFAFLLAYVAWRVATQTPELRQAADTQMLESALRESGRTEFDWHNLPTTDVLSVKVGHRLISLLAPENGAPLRHRTEGVRRALSAGMGFVIPPISVRDDLSLPASGYSIRLHGVEVTGGELYMDMLMAIPSSQVDGDLDGIPATEAAYGMPVVWIKPDDKITALGLGYQVVDCASVLATHLDRTLQDHLDELFLHDNVSDWLEQLSMQAPRLREALNKICTDQVLRKVMRALLKENVPIKNRVPIATSLVDSVESTTDPILLAAEVRYILRREIVAGIVGQKRDIPVCNVENELEDLLLAALARAQQTGKPALDNFAIDPQVLAQLQSSMPSIAAQMKTNGHTPLLLATPQLRPLLARYARLFAPGLKVLSYNEIPERRQLEIVGSLG